VGKVREIRLDRDNPDRVILLFAIERGTPIKEDTEAVLKTQGLTGIAYVELSGGTRESPRLRATAQNQYPVIRTKPSLSARLENVLSTVLAKLDSTSSKHQRASRRPRTRPRSKARSPTLPPCRARSPVARRRSTRASPARRARLRTASARSRRSAP
jgi:hypothetical protein